MELAFGNRIRVLATGIALAIVSIFTPQTVSAAQQCRSVGLCVDAIATPQAGRWSVQFTLTHEGKHYDHFNIRIPGQPQFEVDGDGDTLRGKHHRFVAAGWDGTFSAQTCTSGLWGGHCDSWSTFTADLQIGADERNFCDRYGRHASGTATVAQQAGCRFDYNAGRFSTNTAEHLNWCLGEMRKGAGDPKVIAAARNFANSEDKARTDALQACQASVAADKQQRQEEMRVTGKNTRQCQESYQQCESRIKAQFPPVQQPQMIAAQCTPFLGQCMANAAQAEAAFREERAEEMRVTGKTPAECAASNQQCEARVRNTTVSYQVPAVIAGMCTNYFQQCMANASIAAAEAAKQQGTPQPPPAEGNAGGMGGMQTASTCGVPPGVATVQIADPSLTSLNVRDAPGGTVLTQVPRGAQVMVVGGCGVRIAAGIVANKTQPAAGWCAISSPTIGCVSEQFLVAGMGGGSAIGGAGIVANKPQPDPGQPPQQQGGVQVQIQVQLPEAGQMAQGAMMSATFIRGANIRNGPSSKNTAVLGSLPAGTVVSVIGCQGSWCQLALPQFPVAWTAKQFLQMNGPAMQAPIPQDMGDMGGGMAPAPMDQGGAQTGGGQMASTCDLPPGTATVTIPDPNVTTLNVRDKPGGAIRTQIPRGSQVTVAGGCGVKLNAGLVANPPGGGGAPVPGWCAITSPVVGCVSQQFLTAGVVAEANGGAPPGTAGLAANQPKASFSGTWRAEAQGASYTFQMNQNGNNVSGNYTGGDGSAGQISGKVQGNVLRFRWSQTDGLTGSGRFALAPDGNAFTGSYSLGDNPDVAEGSWNGTRQ